MERAEGVVVARRYRLVRKLGSGGMGSVWLALDLSLDTRCALKLVDDDKAKSEEVRVRFQREAKAAAQLRSPHVVDVFDHGDWGGVPYIAMEFLDGEDLAARLTRLGRLDPGSTYRVIAHVARALMRAHALGIVHRDLKPENIFLVRGDDEEIAKVLDFGIAKHDAYSLQDKATKTGSFLGTPYYVSPEQARGRPTDYRSDLWSLGVIAFECLTGRPPFQADALGELMGQILYEAPPKPSERVSGLLPAVDAWWERASQRDREQRFQSAKELSDALGRALGVTRLVVVPSIPPRSALPSSSDAEVVSPAPSPVLPPELRETMPRESSPAEPETAPTPVPAAETTVVRPEAVSEARETPEARDTQAPLSRTRRSLEPHLSRLRKRHLVGFAIGGIVLGVVVTLGFFSEADETEATLPVMRAPAPREAPAAARPEPEPLPREIAPLPEPEPPPAPPASQVGVPEEPPIPVPEKTPASAPTQTAPARAKKAPAPPKPVKRAPFPDYGI